MSLTASATGYTVFPPKQMEGSDLTSVDFVVIDKEEQRVEALSVLGVPLDLPIGNLALRINQRVSKKGNMLNWYKGHKAI